MAPRGTETPVSTATPRRARRAGWLESRVERSLLRALEGWHDGSLHVWLPPVSRAGEGPLVFGSGLPRAEIRIHDLRLFRRLITSGETGFGESYMAGEWSSPDLPGLIAAGMRNRTGISLDRMGSSSRPLRFLNRVRHAIHANTRRGSRRNIHAHYDLGNEFFPLFLDDTLAYSSAIFPDPAVSLEAAQQEKYRVICQKLELGSDDHLLEIGTGWGGLALHAARTTGCRVTSVTISQEQLALARERIAEAGLADRIDVRLLDYRDLSGVYDKIVSIEMLEAVGRAYWNTFYEKVSSSLRAGGRALIQVICVPDHRFQDYASGSDWIQKYIFPGGCLPSLFELQRAAHGTSSLELDDVEDIGLHYALTLRHWRERFSKNLSAVRDLGFDDVFVRLWDFYLASCQASFSERNTRDYQLLYSA